MRKRFSRAMHVSLALLIVLALVAMPTSRSASAGDVGTVVDLVLLPSSQTVGNIGDIFDITIEAQCNGQDVCGVAAFVDFDPNYLEVQSITEGSTLSDFVVSDYDNVQGTIDYSAGQVAPDFPTGTFTVATIEFKALALTTPTTAILFSTTFPRETKAVYGADDITGTITGGTVTITQTGDVNGDGRVNVLDMT